MRSASILHSNGDALDIAVRDGRIVGVRGRAVDRVNRGRLGPKALHGRQADHSPDRPTRPLVRENGRPVESGRDTAMDRIAARTKNLLDERGPGAVGFCTSGQLFLEEHCTLALTAHVGIRTDHLGGNTRLCAATAAESLEETSGSDGRPGSCEDVDHADTTALFGHDAAETQVAQALLERHGGDLVEERQFPGLLPGRQHRRGLVVVDPRPERSPPCGRRPHGPSGAARRRACRSRTTCATCIWRPRAARHWETLAQAAQAAGTRSCWSWSPPAIRRPSAGCAGPTR
ncbi:molybdopterin-dependent oxidoreductase [Streptomyces sp. NPDC057236]|uniref:molybdopterin-dependent oxidoreductase n=1 Tax=Streptomyces sp. NPDC057236 TaxID=3346059 RepID=UPI00362EBBBE